MIDILAYHGWGFDRTCWGAWQGYCAQKDGVRFQAGDRGYFGQPQSVLWSQASDRKLLLLHSFGLHLCPREYLHQADAIALCNCFLDFHPSAERLRRRSQQMVATMIDQFQQQPEVVLQNFWDKCGWFSDDERHGSGKDGQRLDEQRFVPTRNDELLLADLQALNTQQFPIDLLQSCSQIWVVQARQDRIVSASQTEALILALGDRAHRIDLDCGHTAALNPSTWGESIHQFCQ